MPSAAYKQKAAITAEMRQRETDDIVRLFKADLSRTQIAHQMGLSLGTVSDRLVEAGFPKGEAGRRWTDDENAVIAEAAEDPAATAESIAHRLPGRSTAVIAPKLRSARLALGIKPTQRKPRPTETRRAEQQPTGIPDWPLPPGAYRNNQGITLLRVSFLTGTQTTSTDSQVDGATSFSMAKVSNG